MSQKHDQEILNFWASGKIYAKLKDKTAKGEQFYFCDGPPYATGSIHPGTAWNKCIKDVVCRYKRARGFNVRSQPGFDTHGLPIEVKVEQKLGLTNKMDIEKIGIEKFIGECKAFADNYVKVMTKQFERVGVWMDFDAPYITYKDSYIEKSWGTIKEADAKGLLFQGDYVLPYCTRCETTVANYELEYEDVTDQSAFVKFRLSDKGRESQYFVIWTTTPWTLPANMAIMVHPLYRYAKVKAGKETWIVAEQRLDKLDIFGEGGIALLGTVSGKELEGTKYEHPLADKIRKKAVRKVVLSDEYVTLMEGTGLVHCAPAHGQEDFIIGKRFGIELFSPIDLTGRYTNEVAYEGMHAFEANKRILDDLEACGALVKKAPVTHRYPKCWRCKTKLIYLKTLQWFISISKLKETMLSELDKIRWQPPYGKERFREFVGSAPDWCISRQRYWGIPLPIWVCDKCGKRRIVGSKAELGSGEIDCLPQADPSKGVELHRPFIDKVTFKCSCGGTKKRVGEVLDVWFDSGNAVWASLESAKYTRADFITEGKDQVRGWFYSLLGSGAVLHNEAPYKSVLMHGFFVDENGEKMSKSKGNFVSLEEIMEKFDADTFRLWSLSTTTWDDLKFTWDGLKEATNQLAIVNNIGIYLARFYNGDRVTEEDIRALKLAVEDRYILSRHHSTVQEVMTRLDDYELHKALNAVTGFFVEDLSRFYIKRIKNREGEKGHLAVLYYVVLENLKLLSLFAPFTAEKIYQDTFRKHEGRESICLFDFPKFDYALKDNALEGNYAQAKLVLTKMLDARMKGDMNVRKPIGRAVIVTESAGIAEAVRAFQSVIMDLANVKAISVEGSAPKGNFMEETGEGFTVHLDRELTRELVEEGLLNEIRRRIQQGRKDLKLVEADKILVRLEGDAELLAVAGKYEKELKAQVNAVEIVCGAGKTGEGHADRHLKEWSIDGKKLTLEIRKT